MKQPKKQTAVAEQPKPELMDGSDLMADLLNRPHVVSEATPASPVVNLDDFSALLDKPLVRESQPPQPPNVEIAKYVWVEKQIEMNTTECAACGKSGCPCTPRILKKIVQTVRYQVKA